MVVCTFWPCILEQNRGWPIFRISIIIFPSQPPYYTVADEFCIVLCERLALGTTALFLQSGFLPNFPESHALKRLVYKNIALLLILPSRMSLYISIYTMSGIAHNLHYPYCYLQQVSERSVFGYLCMRLRFIIIKIFPLIFKKKIFIIARQWFAMNAHLIREIFPNAWRSSALMHI